MTEREGQPPLPFAETLELVINLTTGEKRFQKKKAGQRRKPTSSERAIALNNWLSETRFTLTFYGGALAYREAESAKMEIKAGQNTEFGSELGARDEVELALNDVFDRKHTDFKPVRAIDIVTVMKRQATNIRGQLRAKDWIQDYVEWNIDLMSLKRKYSYRFTEDLKNYSRQLFLVAS